MERGPKELASFSKKRNF